MSTSSSNSVNGLVDGAGVKAKESNVAIGHLDYSYVSKCDNAKELEEIITVLRSGSEGLYPDLVEYTEKKLKEINPKSQVLLKDNPVQSYRDLDNESRKAVADDLEDWMNEMLSMDSKLKKSGEKSEVVNGDSLPPIRSTKLATKPKTDNAVKTDTSHLRKTVKPREYKEWDKFDINKELAKIDKNEATGKVKEVGSKNVFEAQPISTKDLKPEERRVRAMKEKEKGNEAFKAMDYREAIVYYSNSLRYEPMAASYNNRAAAELKLERYSEALEDSNKVLELEPNNLKGYLRRGMAFKALKQYSQATKDFNSMLALDENNKRAKELLAEVEELERPKEDAEEAKTCPPLANEKDEEISNDAKSKKKGQRLKIIEIDSTEEPEDSKLVQPVGEGTDDDNKAENGPAPEIRSVKTDLGAGESTGGVPAKNAGVSPRSTGQEPGDDSKAESGFDEECRVAKNVPEVPETSGLGDTSAKDAGSSQPSERETGNDSKIFRSLVDISDLGEGAASDGFRNGESEDPVDAPAKDDGIGSKPVGEETGDDNKVEVSSAHENRAMAEDLGTGGSKHPDDTLAKNAGIGSQSGGEETGDDTKVDDSSDHRATSNNLNAGESKGIDYSTAKSDEISIEKTSLVTEEASENGATTPEAEAVDKPAQAEEKAEVALRLPAKVQSLMEEGNRLYKMGHHAEALQKYTKSVESLWKDRELYSSAVSSLLNNKAACYLKMGDCKQCVKECDRSLELVSDNVRVLVRRGMAYETMEKYAEAFRDFNHVRLLDGSNKLAQEHCSRVVKNLELLHGKAWRKEIFDMNSGSDAGQKTFPECDKNKKHSNEVPLDSPKETEKPTSDVGKHPQPEASPKIDPTKTAPENEANINHKEEFQKTKQEQYLKLKDNGNLLVRQGKHEEAVKHYTDCIKLCPEEVAVYTNRALCYLQLNKYDLAEADCNTALKIQTDNIKALFRRAKARKGLGRYRESSEDLVMVLKRDAKNASAKTELMEVLQLLKKEQKDGGKSAPKRKRIVIKDIEGDSKTPETKTDSLPETKIEFVPETKTDAVPETKTDFLPETKTDFLPETKTDAVPETKTDFLPETKTDAVPETKTDSLPETKTDFLPETKTDFLPETKTDFLPETKTDSVPETKTDFLPETKTDAVPETKTDSLPETKTDSLPETKTDFVPQTKTNFLPETKADSLPETKTDFVPQTKIDFLPETKTDFLPETKIDYLPETKTDSLPETKTDSLPETKTDFLPETKTDFLPETKTDSLPETKIDYLPETKTDFLPETKTDFLPETKTDYLPETKTDFLPETKIDYLPETKIDYLSETKTDFLPETKIDSLPQTKTDFLPETKTDFVPETKTDLIQELKTDLLPKTKTDSVPKTKTAYVPGTKKNLIQEAKTDLIQAKSDSKEFGKEQNKPPVKHNVKSAFQFLQTWQGVKAGDTAEYLNVIKQVNLGDLWKVISNRLDADMIRSMFQALHLELKLKGDLKFVCDFLEKLHRVERFEMILLFQSREEKRGLSKLFDDVVKENSEETGLSNEDLIKLRKKYNA